MYTNTYVNILTMNTHTGLKAKMNNNTSYADYEVYACDCVNQLKIEYS